MVNIPGMPPPGGTPNLPVRRAANTPMQATAPHQGPGGPGRAPQPNWQPRTPTEQWWLYSRGCAAALRAGLPPTPIDVYGPVMEPGEHALLTTEIGYSRYCGTDARYSPVPLIVAGRPAVMFGALAVQGAINHHRKVTAERKAALQWRFHQNGSVVVTTDRLVCSTVPHGQMNFWFGACTEFYPDLHQWSLTLGFDSAASVRLHGPAAPALSLWSAYGILGDGWMGDPRLAPLIS